MQLIIPKKINWYDKQNKYNQEYIINIQEKCLTKQKKSSVKRDFFSFNAKIIFIKQKKVVLK